MPTVAVSNQKGGSAKTTTTINLGAAAAAMSPGGSRSGHCRHKRLAGGRVHGLATVVTALFHIVAIPARYSGLWRIIAFPVQNVSLYNRGCH